MTATSSDQPILVVGAGVVGLSTALYLQRAGRSVTVIDALPPGAARPLAMPA